MVELEYECGEPHATKQERSDAGVRTQMRFPIAAPVTFNWLARNGTQHQGTGRSRNVSEEELCFYSKAASHRSLHKLVYSVSEHRP